MAASKGLLHNKWIRALVVGGAAAAISIVLQVTGALDGPERTTWDMRVRQLIRPTSATDDVVVIYIDQSDLDIMKEDNGVEWPWPRSIYSYIVEFASMADAASLTFDIIFEDEGAGTWQDDMVLQDAAARYGRTIWGAQFFGSVYANSLLPADQQAVAEPWPDYISRPDITVTGLDTLRAEVTRKIAYLEASFPYEFVIPFGAPLAFVNQANDDDGVFRRYQLLKYHVDQPIVGLGIAPLLVDDSLSLAFDRNYVDVDDTRIPIDREGLVLLRYTDDWQPPTNDETELPPEERNTFYATDIIYSVVDILGGVEPAIPPEALEGKHILVGLSASGLLDLRPTPLDARAPGVTVHATMLDNLLSGEFMRDVPLWLVIALLLVLSLGAAMAATYASGVIAEAAIFIGFIAVLFGMTYGGYVLGLWVPLVVPMVAVVLAVVAGNIANYATEGAAKREIRNMFGRYLSPDVISDLEENPEALELGGKEAEISIYFSDIQKFSTISTKLGPVELVEFLNVYLTPMTNMILEEGGLIDKYEGDAVIAMWGAPRKMEDHAQRGLRSVLKCQAALSELRPVLKERIGTEVYQRIGMSSGKAIVGNMGSELRRDYTMIGDAVNLAARLEGANKAFGTYTMVSEDTIRAAGGLEAVRGIGIAVRELGYIAVVGREDKPVRVYEPMHPDEFERRANVLEAYQKGIRLFQAGRFAEAKSIFTRIADLDPAAASYVPRCDQLMANPPVDWNGVWVLTEKG